MKRVLSLLTLLTISASIAPISLNVATQSSTFTTHAVPVAANIKNISINKSGSDAILSTETINLTALGITKIADLQQYTAVELSDFKANFLNSKISNSGYLWKAEMFVEKSDWVEFSKQYVLGESDIYIATTDRKYDLWYDANGNYNLTLSYRFNCMATGGSPVPLNWVQAQTGSIIKFY